MTPSVLRSGLLIACLVTLATTATAVVDGPTTGQGEMAITSHTGAASSGSAGVSRSTLLDDHVTDISLDFSLAGDGEMPPACQEDIREALSTAEGRVCTEQVANLRCPQDDETVYMAPNGCVISALEQQNWTQAPMNHSEENETASNVTLSGEITFRTGGYTVQTDSRTEDGEAIFTINITAPGPNQTVTQAITREQIEVTEDSGTYDSAKATVYIEGEEVYSRSESRGSDGASDQPPRRPAETPRGEPQLRERVKMLEQRVATLESRLTMMEQALQQEGIIEEDGMTPPDTDPRPRNGTQGGDETTTGPGQQPNPGQGIADVIRGIFG